ncbi:MAG: hypothetical protein ACXVEF_12305 [Polyangiales bacterium]
MRAVSLVTGSLVVGLMLGLACEKQPEPPPPPSNAPATPKDAALLLRGTWQVEGFEAAAVSGIASAAQLQAQAATAEAAAVRITYTDRHIKVNVPNQPTVVSTYSIEETHPAWLKIKNGPDTVVITFQDDDHMTVDRRGNSYGAKMKMRRLPGPPPADIAPPPASFTVVGTNDAGHMIVKMNPTGP